MKSKILFLILIFVLVFIPACAAPTLEPKAVILSNPLPAEVMLVRPNGASGELIAYNMTTGQEHHRLPTGFLTYDEEQYYTAVQKRGNTHLKLYNPRTASVTNDFVIAGEWQLDGMSTNGRYLVLTAIPDKEELNRRQTEDIWQTEIKVFDTESGETAKTLSLDGYFEIDAISNNGSSLFLIEQLPPANPEHYLIRAYDLRQDELLPDPLRDKRFFDELMVGYPWGSISDPAGVWYLTLYINTQHDVAFVHALNMAGRQTFCIDLPSGEGDFDALQQYTLTLAPDGQKVYAANAALGIVAEVNLQYQTVGRQSSFPAQPLPGRFQESSAGLNASVLSPDGKTLYFTNGRQLWAYATTTNDISEPLLESDKRIVQGLSVSDDGQWLYIAQEERPLLVLSTTTTTVTLMK